MLKLGKIHPEAITALEEANIVEITGWTPEEIDRQDPVRIECRKEVWAARNTATRKEKKEMSGI